MTQLHENGRIIFAVLFLLGAIANAIILIINPDMYRGFADIAILSFYYEAWTRYVNPNLPLLVGLIVAFELFLFFSLISSGLFVRLGLLLAASFMLFLVPFWWSGGGLLNLVFFLLLMWLSRFEYPVSAIQVLRSRLVGEGI